MKWPSFNYKGLASPSKKLNLKRLLSSEPCDIIFLQETLGIYDLIVTTLQSIKPKWKFQALNAAGRLGGLALGTNPQSIKVTSDWGSHGFLGMVFFLDEPGRNLNIMNIYAPNLS